jgi:hypothetical protein
LSFAQLRFGAKDAGKKKEYEIILKLLDDQIVSGKSESFEVLVRKLGGHV